MRYPFAFGMTISTFKTSASDLLVQKVVEQKEVVDWKRNAAFAAFGCFYLGGVQYMIYVPLFSRIFPNAASFAAKGLRDKFKDIKGMGAVAGQVRDCRLSASCVFVFEMHIFKFDERTSLTPYDSLL
jgi:hypothetical protein